VRILFLVLSIVCALAIPAAVTSTVVLGFVRDPAYYHEGQVKYDVVETTGMTQAAIDRVDVAIVRFFNGDEMLPTALEASGASPVVFNLKEILHMNDVREVIRAIASIQIWSAAVIAIFLAAAVATWNRVGRAALARALIVSSVLTIVVGGLAAAVTYVAFDQLFLTFHELTFHNDYWELDPRTDHLIQMFPFEFWYDAMLAVAFRVLFVTVILFIVGLVLSRRGKGALVRR
jgi:integral membrane protein (TIGR01906 family)